MSEKRASTEHKRILQIPPETTGFPAQKPLHDPLPGAAPERPLSLAWITDDLLRYTQEVWSRACGRPVSEDAAIETLLNVKRFAEVMLKAIGQKGGVRK